jgi:hypothetical protein
VVVRLRPQAAEDIAEVWDHIIDELVARGSPVRAPQS